MNTENWQARVTFSAFRTNAIVRNSLSAEVKQEPRPTKNSAVRRRTGTILDWSDIDSHVRISVLISFLKWPLSDSSTTIKLYFSYHKMLIKIVCELQVRRATVPLMH